jgi:hypothetical protein
MTMEVKAKMNFFHDLVGNRAEGEVFTVGDNATYTALKNAGYVEKVSSAREATNINTTNVEQMNPFKAHNQSAEQVGQAQEQANKEAATAAQTQHEQSLQKQQQANQEAQQQAQNATESHATEFLAEQQKVQQQEQKAAQEAKQATNKTTK